AFPQAELAAVRQALAGIAVEQYDRAVELIRPLPRDSLFRHWILYIRGLAAFHRGDSERAAKLLAAVPADTAPGRAAVPYLYWLSGSDGGVRLEDLPEHVRMALARLAAAPEAAHLIARAERLWHEGRPAEMYSWLRKSIDEFPSESQDWIGTLSEFCLHCLFILPMDARTGYGQFLDEIEHRRRSKSARENKMLLRVLCLDCEMDPDALYLETQWTRFIQLREQLDGVNQRISSLAFESLGSILAIEHSDDDFSRPRRPRMLDADGAMRTLKRSVQLDSDNLNAQLALAHVYHRLKRQGEYSRLLDGMTRRFPDDTNVLILAGTGCLDRKAYVKGLKYLERAFAQDRLNPAIPEAIAIARSLLALDHFRNGRPDAAREAFNAIHDLVVDRQDDFMRSSWTTALRRGVLEHLYGDDAQAGGALAEADAAAPNHESYLLFGHILWKLYERRGTKPDPFAGEFRRSPGAQISAAGAAMLVHILEFWQRRSGAPPLHIAESLIREYLRAAIRRPFTREDARELIERLDRSGPFAREVRPFIKAILKKDRGDPLFRLYSVRYDPPPLASVESRRKTLTAILKEAVRRKDDHAIQAVRRELDALELLLPLPSIDPFDQFDEDEEDEDFVPDSDAMADYLREFSASMDPRERKEFDDFQEMLKNASEEEIRRLKKTLPKGMPDEVFDYFLDSVRRRTEKRGPTEAPAPTPRKRRRGYRNQYQGNLFDL
ncbi:MAG: hypothetical protein ABSH28_13550, partial [Acidobacteriota bacterium]